MKISAVICEYNPFHNGHLYLNQQARRESGALVAIMSGSFTQRGQAAIFSKFKRAEAALKNGADLVIELPSVYAVSVAERFADGGIQIAKALGCVDSIAFGSECGSISEIHAAAQAIDSAEVSNSVAKLMKTGDYYPRAVEKAIDEHFGSEVSAIAAQPNNTLGIEYCRALKRNNAECISPLTFKRTGAAHDSTQPQGNIASASFLRDLAQQPENEKDFFSYMPKNCNEIFTNQIDYNKLNTAVLYQLKRMNPEEIAKLPDVSEGLENRIVKEVKMAETLEELLESIKTKRYTMARIRRIITCAFLGIDEKIQSEKLQYIRVLGFNKTGEKLLNVIKKNTALPLITNVADGYKDLTPVAKRIFDIDVLATDLHSLSLKFPLSSNQDFTNGIIKV